MTMRNTDFTNLLRRHSNHHLPLPTPRGLSAGNRQPNLKEEKDFDKYEGKPAGRIRVSLLQAAALRIMACRVSGAPAKMESGRTEQRNKGTLALRK
jgi:hypothetical protein